MLANGAPPLPDARTSPGLPGEVHGIARMGTMQDFELRLAGVPLPRPLPVRSSRRGENSIALRTVRAVSAGAPSGSPRLATSPKTAGGGWDAAGIGLGDQVRTASAGCPAPGPSPFVPHGEGRIQSCGGQPVGRVTLPRAVCGEGRGGGRPTIPPPRCPNHLGPVQSIPLPGEGASPERAREGPRRRSSKSDHRPLSHSRTLALSQLSH